MKRLYVKLIFVALFTCMCVQAQTDMTDRIVDPDFEQQGPSQWKTNNFGRQGNNEFPLKHGDYYREVWSGGGMAADSYIYQDLTNLPIGTYTLTAACQNLYQNSGNICTGTWIYKASEFLG